VGGIGVKTKRNMKRWSLIVVTTLALLGGSFVALRARAKPPAIDESKLVTAKKGDLAIEIIEVGRIEPERRVELKSKVAGLVAEVRVNEGDKVRAGDVLLSLDAVDYQREVARARTQLARARNAHELAERRRSRARLGVDSGVVSKAELEALDHECEEKRLALAAERIAVGSAGDRVRYTRVLAPFDGTVVARAIEPGEAVTPGVESSFDGKSLLTIADLSRLLVKVDLNQVDVARLAVGQKATLALDALPDRRYTATIVRVAPASVRRPGKDVDVFPVEALVENADRRIKPGMSAEVRIHVEKKRDLLALPIEAVRSASGKSFVTRVTLGEKGADRAEVEVKLGLRNDREVEVVAGVSVGDRILIDPASAEKNETKM
jgi:HlyD family secretion protein/macrolide-specific efflux system membrane fusion protein